jgi:hypothetical protein
VGVRAAALVTVVAGFALLPAGGASSAAAPSAHCHVTDGTFTACADGSAEWSDVPSHFFPRKEAYLYADQADLDPALAGPRSPADTLMLMYDECGRRTPLGPDEYFLVTFDTVEVEDGREAIERYSVHVFADGTIIFFENGAPQRDEQGRLRVREIEGQRGDAGFGPSPRCAFDHVIVEFEIKLTATELELNGGYSPDPIFWGAEPPNRPPVAADDTEKLENGTVDVPVLGNDFDSDGSLDPSSVTIAAAPSKGTASIAAGVVTYTKGDSFEDADTFSYTVRDDEGAVSNAAQVEITSCPPGRTYPVTLPPVLATLNLLKPWEVSYDPLPLTFTTQAPPSPAYCSARSNVGTLNVRVRCRVGPPAFPCPFPPFVRVLVATSTASATLDFFRASDAPVVPVCDWVVTRTGCLLDAGGGGTYVRWTTPGFQITDAFLGRVSYNTGPHTFWANLSALVPSSASLGDKIQAAETFFHTRLISRLSSIDRVAIVQDPPADVLVTDPSGLRTGQTSDGTVLREIPGSEYFETGEATAVLVVQPENGNYQAEALGAPSTPFNLSMAVVDFFGPDAENPTVDEQQVSGEIGPSGITPPFFFLVPTRTGPPENVVTNGTVQLGVNREGHLNVPGGPPSSDSGTTFVGLRYIPTGNEATAPGCLCEGWGVADAVSRVSGYANRAVDGVVNMTVESFRADPDRTVSQVRIGGTFRVTHDYHPSASQNLFEATVTIENISGSAVDARYRRVMDWDVEPTPFSEFVTVVTIEGSERAANVLFSSDDGFASANPLAGQTAILFTGDAVDSGPDDHGALFDFGFGDLAPGEKVTFNIYYGAAGSEDEADAALQAVRAEVYSYGQPSTPDGPTLGKPSTFVFAFNKVGGVPAVPPDADTDGVLRRARQLPLRAERGPGRRRPERDRRRLPDAGPRAHDRRLPPRPPRREHRRRGSPRPRRRRPGAGAPGAARPHRRVQARGGPRGRCLGADREPRRQPRRGRARPAGPGSRADRRRPAQRGRVPDAAGRPARSARRAAALAAGRAGEAPARLGRRLPRPSPRASGLGGPGRRPERRRLQRAAAAPAGRPPYRSAGGGAARRGGADPARPDRSRAEDRADALRRRVRRRRRSEEARARAPAPERGGDGTLRAERARPVHPSLERAQERATAAVTASPRSTVPLAFADSWLRAT